MRELGCIDNLDDGNPRVLVESVLVSVYSVYIVKANIKSVCGWKRASRIIGDHNWLTQCITILYDGCISVRTNINI